MKKIKFYKKISSVFLVIVPIFSEAWANDLSDYNKSREDLIFLQELKDGDSEDHTTTSELFKFDPKVSHQFSADLNFDSNYNATSRQNEYDETQGVVRLVSKFEFNKNLFVRSFFKLSEVSQASETAKRNASPQGSGDRSFENLGLYLEEFVVGYKKDHFGVVVGKFNLNFGTVWQQSFGIWYSGIASQYRQKAKLGTRANYNFGNSKKNGHYVFSLSTFTNDSKNFDGSLINKRDSNSKFRGTPGDSRSMFDSYCASINIKLDLNKDSELTYHVSYVNLAVNKSSSPITTAKVFDQTGTATALNYKHKISEDFGVHSFIEYAEIKSLGGNSSISEKYLTTSISGKFYSNFNLTIGHANQKNIQSNNDGFKTTLTETSVGYSFDKTSLLHDLFLQIGYKHQYTSSSQAGTDKRNSIGLMMVYSRDI